MKKVVLGLSGGVDSAVAASLLKKEYVVHGLFLDIGLPGARQDAASVAESLRIPLVTWDISARLEEMVCKPFVRAYLNGETPNPCVHCNPQVKLKALCDFADEIGAEFIASGHYARVICGRLHMGRPANDQSYMLCRVTNKQLRRLILPLGEMDKSEVRSLAAALSLEIASKPASMEICFVPDGDYAAYIEKRGLVPPPGDFVSEDGSVMGRHGGIHRYTVGQRRGLGISAGRRVFVSKIDAEKNEVVLSDGEGLFAKSLRASDMNWQGRAPTETFSAKVRTRHSKELFGATVTPNGDSAEVIFEAPVRAPTKGQAAVFYDGDMVVGGGIIVDSQSPDQLSP